MNKNPRKPFYIALLLSLLLHVVIFWMLFAGNLMAYILRQPPEMPESSPIVLELESPPPDAPAQEPPSAEESPEAEQPQPLPEEKYYQIEENPNANEQTPENADILALAASVSASPQDILTRENAIKPPVDDPDPTIKETKPEAPEAVIDPETGPRLEDIAGTVAYSQSKEFSRKHLTYTPQQPESSEDLREASSKNTPPLLKDFKGDLVGDVTLSTYAWPWAPWVLEMKYAFYRHLFVPRAYSMGLIEGVTEVYLKIGRDGTLISHKLVQSAGHETLKESTLNAFLSSVPWKPLPNAFPDEYLELRVRVIYPNLKELFAREQKAQ